MTSDRVVHAKYNGVEVVRYDDEWFLEPCSYRTPNRYSYGTPSEKHTTPLTKKKKVTMEEAAKAAAEGIWLNWQPVARVWPAGFQVYWGQEGGEEFEEIVKELRPILHLEIEFAQLGHGHDTMMMKCPGCQEWMTIGDSQIRGSECVDHTRGMGGCGFHGYITGPNAGYICDLGEIGRARAKEDEKKAEKAQKKDQKQAKRIKV